MTRNQRVLLFAAVATVVVFWFAVIGPIRADVRVLKQGLPEIQQQFAEMVDLYDAYQRLHVSERTLEEWVSGRPANFGLFAHVTEVAQRQGLVPASLRPSARPLSDLWQLERVKVELQDVSLSTLIGFLHALTAPQNVVRVDAFELRGSPSGMNVTLEVQTLTIRQ